MSGGESQDHLKRAERSLEASRLLIEKGYFSDSISRSYYASFHAVKAVLDKLGIDRGSHHAVWSAFGEFVANPGLIAPRFHKEGWELFTLRREADYLADPEEDNDDAERALRFSTEFVAACKAFLGSKEG